MRHELDGDRILYFYVTDSEERLVGVVPARRLLLADPSSLVGEIMTSPAVSVADDEPFRRAIGLLASQRLLGLPVVNNAGQLRGMVDVSGSTERLFHLERHEAAAELFQLFGDGARNVPASEGSRARVPVWLLIRIGGAIVLAILTSFFRGAFARQTAIVFSFRR
jgi:magnesium transporter